MPTPGGKGWADTEAPVHRLLASAMHQPSHRVQWSTLRFSQIGLVLGMTHRTTPVMVVSSARMRPRPRPRSSVPVASALSFLRWAPGPVTLTPLGETAVVTKPEHPGTASIIDSSAFLRLTGPGHQAVAASPGDALPVAAIGAVDDVPAHLAIASLCSAAANLFLRG